MEMVRLSVYVFNWQWNCYVYLCMFSTDNRNVMFICACFQLEIEMLCLSVYVFN